MTRTASPRPVPALALTMLIACARMSLTTISSFAASKVLVRTSGLTAAWSLAFSLSSRLA